MTPIYLDHNATTPVLPEVARAMHDALLAGPANPASQHQWGRRARQRIEDARETIGRLIGAQVDRFDGDRLIFTSGGTESNHLALLGLVGEPPGHVIASAIEHPSVGGVLEQLVERGFVVDRLPVNRHGVVEVERLDDLLRPETRLVTVMLANNETGVLQPVAEVVRKCSPRGILVHTDAVQVAGKLPVHFESLGVAAMTLAAHKLHGPVGVGALVVRRGVALRPLFSGGFQQAGLRPGTESVALAVGFEVALRQWHEERAARRERLTMLRDRFEARLRAELSNIVVHGAAVERLPHTSNIAFPGVDRQALLMALDLAGVACSTGSACASGSSEPSPVLLAMGVERGLVDASLRFSAGAQTTLAEIDEATERITRIYRDLRAKNRG
ncbi:MAG: cysteine desulfurase [Planctomycetaceae bacterium]|nr:cysteine desulfurase [Planctomycetaceae bacterium]